MRVLVMFPLALLSATPAFAQSCPPQPGTTDLNLKAEVVGKAETIAKLGEAEIRAQAERSTKELGDKYPQADILFIRRMLYATVCPLIVADSSFTTDQKTSRLSALAEGRSGFDPAKPPEPIVLTHPDIPTLDGESKTVGSISGISITIKPVVVNGVSKTAYSFNYSYYNGSGTWRGSQSIHVLVQSTNKAELLWFDTPLDRGRCIYGGSEPRNVQGDYTALSGVPSILTVVVSRVSGVQTRC